MCWLEQHYSKGWLHDEWEHDLGVMMCASADLFRGLIDVETFRQVTGPLRDRATFRAIAARVEAE